MNKIEMSQEFKEFLGRNKIDLAGKKIVLFGTGQMSKLLSVEPAYYVDNNEMKWGKSFKKKIIKSPQALVAEEKDRIFILVASQFYEEIATQLKEMGFEENVNFFEGKALFEQETKKKYYYKFVRSIRRFIKNSNPHSLYRNYRRYRLKFEPWLLFPPAMGSLSYYKRIALLRRFKLITRKIPCPHSQAEIIAFVGAVLKIPSEVKGCIVEAGAFKGGSASKFSIAAKIAGRELYIFDSFAGLPENKESHEKSILGHSIKGWFSEGKFCGSLEEVKSSISKYGEIVGCNFIKGWFEETMPSFKQRIVAVYLDVDLASSTKTCLKYLYPLLAPGGVIFSQDGDFPLVIEVFDSDEFWEEEVGCKKPYIEGLGEKKLVKIVKLE